VPWPATTPRTLPPCRPATPRHSTPAPTGKPPVASPCSPPKPASKPPSSTQDRTPGRRDSSLSTGPTVGLNCARAPVHRFRWWIALRNSCAVSSGATQSHRSCRIWRFVSPC
jgi:hypothetical protein